MKHIESSLITLKAVSPIHAGSGSSTGAVDNPIQRERHTSWPMVQATSFKGALRAHCRSQLGAAALADPASNARNMINWVFGSDSSDYWDEGVKKATFGDIKEDRQWPENLAGAISVSDLKLLFFPVRSNIAPFVYVTSPAVLKRFFGDLTFLGFEVETVPNVKDECGYWINEDCGGDRVILEDAVITPNQEVIKIEIIRKLFAGLDRILIVSDDMYDYCVTSCTEIQTQIKIDPKTGTAQSGALRYEELLQADSVLYGVITYNHQVGETLKAKAIKDWLRENVQNYIQIGGDETLGRGICQIQWVEPQGGES
ncbi:MAG: type III-B CRISPR module RAMP protein Cmr4 [Acidobacteria bacterium]|nr:MAG: type III-B CRISPR module RAMP protein Cmr4 [Acidobacteriota bacterium]